MARWTISSPRSKPSSRPPAPSSRRHSTWTWISPCDMTVLTGTWFDGRQSRPRAATLERPDAGTLRVSSEGEVADFALASVAISPRLGNTPRVLRLPGAGHLEVEDGAELHAWFRGQSRIERW